MGFYDNKNRRNFYDKTVAEATTYSVRAPNKVSMPEDAVVLEEFPEYSITPRGEIYNKRGKLLSPATDTKGYLHISLYKNGQRYTRRVHLLVGKTFLPVPEELADCKNLVIDHIDQDRTHCSVDNLQWVSQSENIAKAYEQGRVSAQAFPVKCIEDNITFTSCTKAAAHYNISKATIQSAIRERNGYVVSLNKHFEFIDNH